MPVFIQIAMLAALAGSFLVYASARHQPIKDGGGDGVVGFAGALAGPDEQGHG